MQLRLLPVTAAAMILGVSQGFLNPSLPAFINTPSTQSFTYSSSLQMSTYDYTTKYSSEGTYGIEGPRREKTEATDPEENIQGYIAMPEPIAAKENLSGTVLVSGWVKTTDRSDQTVFDLLNHEDSAMRFDKIVAFVNDEKFAKKRLLSRSARYTGLLDKLSFEQAAEPDALPTAAQLEGVKHWVANVENGDLAMVNDIASLCQGAEGLENVSILLSGAIGLDVSQTVASIQALDDTSDKCKFAIVAVGEIKEHQEGSKAYDIADLGTDGGVITEGQIYSRDESLRMVTELLQLEAGSNKALTLTEVASTNTTENIGARLVKGLREAGFTRPQEIDHMISKGIVAYDEAVKKYKQEKWEKENPDPELLEKEAAEREKEAAIAWEKSEREFGERKTKEIEDTARAWAKREYFRKSMGGNMGMAEEEYVKSVWERAMFEGDLKYRMMHGGETDERKELAEFEEKQNKKKAAALKRAKEALEGKMGGLLDNDDDDDDDEE